MAMIEQRLLCEIGGNLIPMIQVNEELFVDELKPKDLSGIPQYYCMTSNDGLRLWPKPIKDCKIWRLEPQPHADMVV